MRTYNTIINKNSVFCLSFILISILYCINASNLDLVEGFPVGLCYHFFRLSSFVLLAIKIFFFTRYSKNEFFLFMLLFSLSLLTYNISKNDYAFILTLFIIGAKDIDYSQICKITIAVYGIFIALMVIFSSFEIVPSTISYDGHNIFTGDALIRRSFGFEHVNMLGGFSLLIFISFLIYKGKDFGLMEAVISVVISLVLFFVVNTKTSALIIFLVSIIVVLNNIGEKINSNLIIKFCKALMIAAIAVSFIPVMIYDSNNSFHIMVDRLLSLRISYAYNIIENYGFSMFGRNITFISSVNAVKLGVQPVILDNAYLHLIVRYGVFEFIAVVGMYYYAFIYNYRRNNTVMCIAIATMMIVGIFEKWIFMLNYCTLLLSITNLSIDNNIESGGNE